MWLKRILGLIFLIGAFILTQFTDAGEPLFRGSGFLAVMLALMAGQMGTFHIPGTGWAPLNKSFRLLKNRDVRPHPWLKPE